MRKILSVLLILCFVASSVYGADEWAKIQPAGTASPSNIDDLVLVNNEALDRVLSNLQRNCSLAYASASTLTINIGEIVCSNSGGTLRKMRALTTAITLTWANIDTGAEESSQTYYVFAVADTDATTFTGLITKSSSAPTGATYYKRIGSFLNNASGDITRGSITNDDNYYGLMLGDWVSKSTNTSYQASTDGTVTAYRTSGDGEILTDASNPPTTVRTDNEPSGGLGVQSMTCPVKRGDYWKLTTDGTYTTFWIPNE